MGEAMGEVQGRGSMSGIAACDVCFTPLTRLGSRLRFVPRHPPFGKKGGLILVPCHSARSLRMGGAMGEAQGRGEEIKAEIRKDTAPDIGAVSAGKSFIPFLIVTE